MAVALKPGQTVVALEQDKDANKVYRFNLGVLLSSGDPLATVTWESSSPDLVISNPTNDLSDCVLWISGGVPKRWYSCVGTWTAQSGVSDQFVIRVYIKEDAELAEQMGSDLFPNKFAAVQQLRRDRLVMAAQNHFSGAELTSEYIWEKLCAAEAQISRMLRVRFVPTTFFPTTPTEEQIAALDGAPWDEDTGYDFEPSMFSGDRWGFIQTHHKPIISVSKLSYDYPGLGGVMDISNDWLQIDKKYGHIRIVPSASTPGSMSPSFLQVIGSGRTIPNMIQITYVAGLKDAAGDYPELVDVVKKMAVLKIIEDGFLPQSGSISADGLSQSMSVDMGKYEDTIDVILNGASGSNGGLKAAIHGIRVAVM